MSFAFPLVRRALGNGKPGTKPAGQGYPEATSTLCPTLGGPLEGAHLIHIISQLKIPGQTLPRVQPHSRGLPGTQEELQALGEAVAAASSPERSSPPHKQGERVGMCVRQGNDGEEGEGSDR